MYRLRRRESISAAVEFAAFQCRLASRLDLAPKWERPYSRGMSWVRLKSPFVIIHAVALRLRGRHRRSVFSFSAASKRLFFFNWPLGLNRVCLDSAKCSIYFSCWAASIFCNMHAHILLHMPPYNTRTHTNCGAVVLSFSSYAFAELSIIVHYSSYYVQRHSYTMQEGSLGTGCYQNFKSKHCHFPWSHFFMYKPP